MTNRSNEVAITVPMSVWGRLASEADLRGSTVADVLVVAIQNTIRRSHRDALILGLLLQGHTDQVITTLTAESPGHVREVRKAAGIKANRRGPGNYDKEKEA